MINYWSFQFPQLEFSMLLIVAATENSIAKIDASN